MSVQRGVTAEESLERGMGETPDRREMFNWHKAGLESVDRVSRGGLLIVVVILYAWELDSRMFSRI